MLGTRNHFIVDRRVYAYKGSWQNPQQDLSSNIFYFISRPQTLVAEWQNGREVIVPEIEITIFGEHPIVKDDIITFNDGSKYKVIQITLNYYEPNILVRDMLKPRVESMVLVLR